MPDNVSTSSITNITDFAEIPTSVLVAVISTSPNEFGAIKSPLLFILPLVALQSTLALSKFSKG